MIEKTLIYCDVCGKQCPRINDIIRFERIVGEDGKHYEICSNNDDCVKKIFKLIEDKSNNKPKV